jgi:PBP1b-binding outer membrane lipoprotein LpoB
MFYKSTIILITTLFLIGCSSEQPTKPTYKHDYSKSDKAYEELDKANSRY